MDMARREQQHVEMPLMRRGRLSAHNLRIHTAALSKQPCFPIGLMHEECVRSEEEENNETPVEYLGFSFDGLSPQDVNMKVRRQASMDALGLYSGNVASLSTPMRRLIAEETRANRVDVETSDASEWASELSGDAGGDDASSVGAGSLQASSDTLSVTREHFLETAREQKGQSSRNWRRLRLRRRSTFDKMKRALTAQAGRG